MLSRSDIIVRRETDCWLSVCVNPRRLLDQVESVALRLFGFVAPTCVYRVGLGPAVTPLVRLALRVNHSDTW